MNYALQDSHDVKILVRSPDKIVPHDSLTILKGNVLNKDLLEQALFGTEVVISTLGTDGTSTLSVSISLIIEGMKKYGIKRIITVGTAGILLSRSQPDRLRFQSKESKRTTSWASEEHFKVYNSLSESDLHWTIVCPTRLGGEIYTGCYRLEPNHLPEGGASISFPDVAECVYKQVFNTEYLNTRIGIAY